MGAWAADTLIRRIEAPGSPPEQSLLFCPLVERGSVAPPSA
jgi:LacI family transcriptional regulator